MQAIKITQQIKTPLTKNKSGALFKMKQNFQNYKSNKGYTLEDTVSNRLNSTSLSASAASTMNLNLAGFNNSKPGIPCLLAAPRLSQR